VRRVKTEHVLVGLLAGLALVIRLVGRHEITPDMRNFLAWYDELKAVGGWPGLGREIGNYNAPILYLLAILTYLPGPALIKIKLTWIVFDALLVYFGYRIVALRWADRRIPTLAALVLAFLPTAVINSSVYGQCDAMWAGFVLGGLYYLLRGRQWWGVALCTAAIAVKPQAIFIFPVLALLAMAGRLRWRTLLVVPIGFLALDLPAMIAGRAPVELLTLYDPARQSKYTQALTAKAPSVYAFLPVTTRLETLRTLGYIFAAVLVIGIIYALIASRVRLDAERIVTTAALFAIALPFVLPGMHERYFYLADVLSVVLAFYRPRLWFVPLIVQAASLLSYLPFLFVEAAHGPFVPLEVLATMMLGALVIVGYGLLRGLVDAQRGQGLLQLIGLDQDVTGLRTLRRADYAPRLHQVHEPAGLGETHPEFTLQHRGRPELRRDDQLDRLDQHL
jgi:Gpi18-like mannosyltransferase